jgi:hypothetical protein
MKTKCSKKRRNAWSWLLNYSSQTLGVPPLDTNTASGMDVEVEIETGMRSELVYAEESNMWLERV